MGLYLTPQHLYGSLEAAVGMHSGNCHLHLSMMDPLRRVKGHLFHLNDRYRSAVLYACFQEQLCTRPSLPLHREP